MTKGYLKLETGEIFAGDWIGAEREVTGEVVFNTSMTGYQEITTDPSYAGQIITFCYPIIGNYGVNKTDKESSAITAEAVIVSESCNEPSHFEAHGSFAEELNAAGIPGLSNVDTRALVTVIRKHQTVRGKVVMEKNKDQPITDWHMKDSITLVKEVAAKKIERTGDGDYHIVLVDFGFKKSILAALLEENCSVTIVPYDTSFSEIKELEPDGILLSNGPGDPIDMREYFPKIKRLTENYPTLGICLGHQLIALAYGAKTEKMQYGHRGANHPVKNLVTGKVHMTSQNHGYVVVEDSMDTDEFDVVLRNVNDKTLEGIKHRKLPVQSVQFHPEAHPGPSDTTDLFHEFIQQVVTSGGTKYAKA